MTEQNENVASVTASPTPSVEASAPPPEGYVAQAAVDKLAGQLRAELREAKAVSAVPVMQSPVAPTPVPAAAREPSTTDVAAMVSEQLDQKLKGLATQEADKQQQAHIDRQAQKISANVAEVFKGAPDKQQAWYAKVVQGGGLGNQHWLLDLCAETPNSAELLEVLADDPGKIGMLANLVQLNPNLARQQVTKLSSQIIQNQTPATPSKGVFEPVSQMTPSYGGDTNRREGQPPKLEDWERG